MFSWTFLRQIAAIRMKSLSLLPTFWQWAPMADRSLGKTSVLACSTKPLHTPLSHGSNRLRGSTPFPVQSLLRNSLPLQPVPGSSAHIQLTHATASNLLTPSLHCSPHLTTKPLQFSATSAWPTKATNPRLLPPTPFLPRLRCHTNQPSHGAPTRIVPPACLRYCDRQTGHSGRPPAATPRDSLYASNCSRHRL